MKFQHFHAAKNNWANFVEFHSSNYSNRQSIHYYKMFLTWHKNVQVRLGNASMQGKSDNCRQKNPNKLSINVIILSKCGDSVRWHIAFSIHLIPLHFGASQPRK